MRAKDLLENLVFKRVAGSVNHATKRSGFNLRKMTAVITTVCFLLASAFGQAISAISNMESGDSQYKHLMNDFIIPSSAGKVTKARYFGSDKVIINIQDLHCHPEVQKNISRIISALDEKYGVSGIYMEGAYGDIDTSWITSIEDKKIRLEITDALLKNGELTGVEYYSANSNKNCRIHGLENEKVYKDNSLRLQQITDNRAEIDSLVQEVSKKLNKAKGLYYNRAQMNLEKNALNHRAGKLDSVKYYSMLKKYGNNLDVDVYGYTNLVGLLDLFDLQKKMNYNKVSRQMQNLVALLKQKLPYNAYNALLDKTKNFSKSDELYVYLSSLSRRYNINIASNFPELNKFFTYVNESQQINPTGLPEEENRLLFEMNTRLSRNSSERDVVFLINFLRHFEDFFNNRISPDNYEYFIKNIEKFKLLFENYTNSKAVAKLDAYYNLLNKFYQVNIARNQWFIKNIMGDSAENSKALHKSLSFEDETDKTISSLAGAKSIEVVVTGGFHTPDIEKIFAERNTSFITITPNVTENTKFSDIAYGKLMKEQNRIFVQTMAVLALSIKPLDVQTQKVLFVELSKLIDGNNLSIEAIENGVRAWLTAWKKNKDVQFNGLQAAGKDKFIFNITINGVTHNYEFKLHRGEEPTLIADSVAAGPGTPGNEGNTPSSEAGEMRSKLAEIKTVLGESFPGAVISPASTTRSRDKTLPGGDIEPALDIVSNGAGIIYEVAEGKEGEKNPYQYFVLPLALPASAIPGGLMKSVSERFSIAAKPGREISELVQAYIKNQFKDSSIPILDKDAKSIDTTLLDRKNVVYLNTKSVMAVPVIAKDGENRDVIVGMNIEVPVWVRSIDGYESVFDEWNMENERNFTEVKVHADENWLSDARYSNSREALEWFASNQWHFFDVFTKETIEANAPSSNHAATVLAEIIDKIDVNDIVDTAGIFYEKEIGEFASRMDTERGTEVTYHGKHAEKFQNSLNEVFFLSNALYNLAVPKFDKVSGTGIATNNSALRNSFVRFYYRVYKHFVDLALSEQFGNDLRMFEPLRKEIGDYAYRFNRASRHPDAKDISSAGYAEMLQLFTEKSVELSGEEKSKLEKIINHYDGGRWCFDIMQLQMILSEDNFVKAFPLIKVSPIKVLPSRKPNMAVDGSGRIANMAIALKLVSDINAKEAGYRAKYALRTQKIAGASAEEKHQVALNKVVEMFNDEVVHTSGLEVDTRKGKKPLSELVGSNILSFEASKETLNAKQDFKTKEPIQSVYPVIIKLDGNVIGTIYVIDCGEFTAGMTKTGTARDNIPRPIIVEDEEGSDIYFGLTIEATPGAVDMGDGWLNDETLKKLAIKVKSPTLWHQIGLMKLTGAFFDARGRYTANNKSEDARLHELIKQANEGRLDDNGKLQELLFVKTQITPFTYPGGGSLHNLGSYLQKVGKVSRGGLTFITPTSCSTNGASYVARILTVFFGFGRRTLSLIGLTDHMYTSGTDAKNQFGHTSAQKTGAAEGVILHLPNIIAFFASIRVPTGYRHGKTVVVGGSVFDFELGVPYAVPKDVMLKYLDRVGLEFPDDINMVGKGKADGEGRYTWKENISGKRTGSIVFRDLIKHTINNTYRLIVGYDNEMSFSFKMQELIEARLLTKEREKIISEWQSVLSPEAIKLRDEKAAGTKTVESVAPEQSSVWENKAPGEWAGDSFVLLNTDMTILQLKTALWDLLNVNLEGKTVAVRGDFNVTVNEHGDMKDDSHVQALVDTIKLLRLKGARVVLYSHLEKPGASIQALEDEYLKLGLDETVAKPLAKRGVEATLGLNAAGKRLQDLLGEDVFFDAKVFTMADVPEHNKAGVILFENTALGKVSGNLPGIEVLSDREAPQEPNALQAGMAVVKSAATAPNGSFARSAVEEMVKAPEYESRGTEIDNITSVAVYDTINESVINELVARANLGTNAAAVSLYPQSIADAKKAGLEYIGNIVVPVANVGGLNNTFMVYAQKLKTANGNASVIYIKDNYEGENSQVITARKMQLLGGGTQVLVGLMMDPGTYSSIDQLIRELPGEGEPGKDIPPVLIKELHQLGLDDPRIMFVNGRSGALAIPGWSINDMQNGMHDLGDRIKRRVVIQTVPVIGDEWPSSIPHHLFDLLGINRDSVEGNDFDTEEFAKRNAYISGREPRRKMFEFSIDTIRAEMFSFVSPLRNRKNSQSVMRVKPGVDIKVAIAQMIPTPYRKDSDPGRGTLNILKDYINAAGEIGFSRIHLTDLLDRRDARKINTGNIDESSMSRIDKIIAGNRDDFENFKSEAEWLKGTDNENVYKEQWLAATQLKEAFALAKQKDVQILVTIAVNENGTLDTDLIRRTVKLGAAGIRLDFSKTKKIPSMAGFAALEAAVPEAVIMIEPSEQNREALRDVSETFGFTFIAKYRLGEEPGIYLSKNGNVSLEVAVNEDDDFKSEQDFAKKLDKAINSEARGVILPGSVLSGYLEEYPKFPRDKVAGQTRFLKKLEITEVLAGLIRTRIADPKNPAMMYEQAYGKGITVLSGLDSGVFDKVATFMENIRTIQVAPGHTVASSGLNVFLKAFEYLHSLNVADRDELLDKLAREGTLFKEFKRIVEYMLTSSEVSGMGIEKHGKELLVLKDYVLELERKASISDEINAKKVYNQMLEPLAEGLLAHLDDRKYGTSEKKAFPNAFEEEAYLRLSAQLSSFVARDESGKAIMITGADPGDEATNMYYKMLAIQGSMLAKGRYDAAEDILLEAANKIKTWAGNNELKGEKVNAAHMFAEAVFNYRRARGEDAEEFIRKQDIVAVIGLALDGYDKTGNGELDDIGSNALYHNTAQIFMEWATDATQRRKAANIVAVGSNKRIQQYLKQYSGELADNKVNVNWLFAISLSHNRGLLSDEDKLLVLRAVDALLSPAQAPYGIKQRNGDNTVWPMMIGHYIDAKKAAYGNKLNPAQMHQMIRGIIKPLMHRFIKDGILPMEITDTAPYKSAKGISFAASVAELFRVLDDNLDPYNPAWQEKLMKAGQAGSINNGSLRTLLGAA